MPTAEAARARQDSDNVAMHAMTATPSTRRIAFLDIGATAAGSGPDFEMIADIAAEAFMPFAYGGGNG